MLRTSEDLTIGSFPCGYYYGMNNPLLERADRVLRILVDTGIHRKFVRRYYWLESVRDREFHRNGTNAVSPWNPLDVRQVAPLYLIVSVMLLASLGILLAERMLSVIKAEKAR